MMGLNSHSCFDVLVGKYVLLVICVAVCFGHYARFAQGLGGTSAARSRGSLLDLSKFWWP